MPLRSRRVFIRFSLLPDDRTPYNSRNHRLSKQVNLSRLAFVKLTIAITDLRVRRCHNTVTSSSESHRG